MKRGGGSFREVIGAVGEVFAASTGPGRVVPPSGVSAWLIIFAAAATTFLAIAALAFALSASRLASAWSTEIAATATIRIAAPAASLDRETEATLRVLRSTPGIADARIMSREEQSELLTPWVGPDMPLEEFALPRLIALKETAEGPDRDGLRLRLQAEAPSARYDDHGAWRDPIVAAARRVQTIGLGALVLVLAVLVAMVVLAAQAAVASNAEVIRTLRLIGAKDLFIVKAFVRRLTLRALIGAVIGMLLGIFLLMTQDSTEEAVFMTGLGFAGFDWVWGLLLPVLVAGVTFLAARTTIFAMLRKLT